MKLSPMQQVKKSFESRAKLVEQLVPMVDRQRGDSTDDEVKSRLMGLSNTKLLRLYRSEQAAREKFGDRAKIVAHIVDARKKAGLSHDAKFVGSLERHSKARLLDMTNIKYAPAPKKLTPEERLAKKRGRKERERALSKIATQKTAN